MSVHSSLQVFVCAKGRGYMQILKNHSTGEVESSTTKDGHDIIKTVCGEPPNGEVYHFQTAGVVGNGSFGVVFEATCLETSETVRFCFADRQSQCGAAACMQILLLCQC